MSNMDPKSFQQDTGTPVTAEMFEKHREDDAYSSADSSYKQYKSQLREMEKGKLGKRFEFAMKGLGVAGQASTMFLDEKMQRQMQPLLRATQVLAGASNTLLSAVFGGNAEKDKMNFLKQQVTKYDTKMQDYESKHGITPTRDL